MPHDITIQAPDNVELHICPNGDFYSWTILNGGEHRLQNIRLLIDRVQSFNSRRLLFRDADDFNLSWTIAILKPGNETDPVTFLRFEGENLGFGNDVGTLFLPWPTGDHSPIRCWRLNVLVLGLSEQRRIELYLRWTVGSKTLELLQFSDADSACKSLITDEPAVKRDSADPEVGGQSHTADDAGGRWRWKFIQGDKLGEERFEIVLRELMIEFGFKDRSRVVDLWCDLVRKECPPPYYRGGWPIYEIHKASEHCCRKRKAKALEQGNRALARILGEFADRFGKLECGDLAAFRIADLSEEEPEFALHLERLGVAAREPTGPDPDSTSQQKKEPAVQAKTSTAGKVGRPGAQAIDGNLVKKIRGDLKQEDFASRAGISVDVLQTAENQGRATEATIDKICRGAKAIGKKLKPEALKRIVPQEPPK